VKYDTRQMVVANFLDVDEFERNDHQILTKVTKIEEERFLSSFKEEN
jgi:hypothetical protein